MRTMYDSVTPSDIPTSAQIVGGYVDGRYAWGAGDWGRFPNAIKVRIAVFSTTNDGHVGDCETGDMSPANAVAWVRLRRSAGADPTVYCSQYAWPTVQAAFNAAGVAQPHWWIAAYPGIGAALYGGAVAHQYADEGPNGEHVDMSVVADYWPGVDGDEDMPLTQGDADLVAHTIANWGCGGNAEPVDQRPAAWILWRQARDGINFTNRQVPSGVPESTYTADGSQYAANADSYGYDLAHNKIPALDAKLDALSTGGVDLDALATAVAGKIGDSVATAVATAVANELEKRLAS